MKITTSQIFAKDIKRLKKKYKNITQDVDDFLQKLQDQTIIGDRIQELPQHELYKARIKNSSNKTGKSGGFRIIYFLKIEGHYHLLTIYSKSEKTNITKSEILKAIK